MKALRLFVVVLLATASAPTFAEWATDADMAEDALDPVIGSRLEPSVRNARIQERRLATVARARLNPEELTSGHVVFNRGVSVKILATLAGDYNLEIVGLNVKLPLNNRGGVRSILIGSEELLRSRGSFRERAEHAIGVFRYEFMQTAEVLSREEPVEAANSKRMAHAPMRIYACDVIAPAGSLADLIGHQDIQIVTVQPRDRSEVEISAYTQRKQEYADAWRKLEASGLEKQ